MEFIFLVPSNPLTFTAFLTMAAEIKNRMALVPQQEDKGKGSVNVGGGTTVGKPAGGGGCC